MTVTDALPRGFASAVETALAATGTTRVVVVTGEGVDAQSVQARWPGLQWDEVSAVQGLDALHVGLCLRSRAALVVDVSCQGPAIPRLQRCAMHVEPGGYYLALLDAARPGQVQRVRTLVTTVVDMQSQGQVQAPNRRNDRRPRDVRDLHAFAASVEDLRLENETFSARALRRHPARIDERHVRDYLRRGPERGRILDVVPRISAHAGKPRLPSLTVREYYDATCGVGRILQQGDVLLPDTFKDPYKRRVKTPLVHDWAPGFVAFDGSRDEGAEQAEEPTLLEGRWLYLDNRRRSHFGHAFTEQLGQLWALERPAMGSVDGALMTGPAPKQWELALFEAAGIPPQRVRTTESPVTVERLVSVSPAYVIGRFVHPEMLPLYRRVGANLRAARTADARGPRRLFLTRRGNNRPCRNLEEVEQAFVAAGFMVVSPEDFPLHDQAALFADAEVVGGFAGSGMFPFICAPSVRQVIAVTSTAYHAWNELHLGALANVDVAIVRSEAEVRTERFSSRMFQSGFTVDWSAEGQHLRHLLEHL